MSDKSIQLQIALPRTFEASKIQEQLGRKPIVDQDQITSNQLQLDERNRNRSVQLSEADSTKLKDRQNQNNQQQHQHEQNKQSNDNERKNEATHPYKGKTIDYSL